MTRTATLIGATGLVGGHLYRLLQADGTFSRICVLGRRPFPNNDPKTEVRVVDFSDIQALRDAISGSDVVFCAVGTTQKKVKGDRDGYRKVDFDIPAESARLAAESGAACFILVSAVGAHPGSSNFYLRLKGEAEEAVRASGVASVVVVRPSMLLGNRSESRPAERLGQIVMQATSPLFLGGLQKYKPIHARDVAAAMLAAAKQAAPGFHVLEYEAMKKIAPAG